MGVYEQFYFTYESGQRIIASSAPERDSAVGNICMTAAFSERTHRHSRQLVYSEVLQEFIFLDIHRLRNTREIRAAKFVHAYLPADKSRSPHDYLAPCSFADGEVPTDYASSILGQAEFSPLCEKMSIRDIAQTLSVTRQQLRTYSYMLYFYAAFGINSLVVRCNADDTGLTDMAVRLALLSHLLCPVTVRRLLSVNTNNFGSADSGAKLCFTNDNSDIGGLQLGLTLDGNGLEPMFTDREEISEGYLAIFLDRLTQLVCDGADDELSGLMDKLDAFIADKKEDNRYLLLQNAALYAVYSSLGGLKDSTAPLLTRLCVLISPECWSSDEMEVLLDALYVSARNEVLMCASTGDYNGAYTVFSSVITLFSSLQQAELIDRPEKCYGICADVIRSLCDSDSEFARNFVSRKLKNWNASEYILGLMEKKYRLALFVYPEHFESAQKAEEFWNGSREQLKNDCSRTAQLMLCLLDDEAEAAKLVRFISGTDEDMRLAFTQALLEWICACQEPEHIANRVYASRGLYCLQESREDYSCMVDAAAEHWLSLLDGNIDPEQVNSVFYAISGSAFSQSMRDGITRLCIDVLNGCTLDSFGAVSARLRAVDSSALWLRDIGNRLVELISIEQNGNAIQTAVSAYKNELSSAMFSTDFCRIVAHKWYRALHPAVVNNEYSVLARAMLDASGTMLVSFLRSEIQSALDSCVDDCTEPQMLGAMMRAYEASSLRNYNIEPNFTNKLEELYSAIIRNAACGDELMSTYTQCCDLEKTVSGQAIGSLVCREVFILRLREILEKDFCGVDLYTELERFEQYVEAVPVLRMLGQDGYICASRYILGYHNKALELMQRMLENSSDLNLAYDNFRRLSWVLYGFGEEKAFSDNYAALMECACVFIDCARANDADLKTIDDEFYEHSKHCFNNEAFSHITEQYAYLLSVHIKNNRKNLQAIVKTVSTARKTSERYPQTLGGIIKYYLSNNLSKQDLFSLYVDEEDNDQHIEFIALMLDVLCILSVRAPQRGMPRNDDAYCVALLLRIRDELNKVRTSSSRLDWQRASALAVICVAAGEKCSGYLCERKQSAYCGTMNELHAWFDTVAEESMPENQKQTRRHETEEPAHTENHSSGNVIGKGRWRFCHFLHSVLLKCTNVIGKVRWRFKKQLDKE